MERKAAFTPRIRRGEQGERGGNIEGPLQELAQDKAEVEGYNFALRAVLNREVPSSAVLRALSEPSFGGGSYLTDRIGNFVFTSRPGDPNIRREEILGKRLREEQIEPLLEIVREQSEAARERVKAESEIEGFNFAINLALRGYASSQDVFRALSEPSFGGGSYLTDRIGNFVFTSRPGDPNIRREEILGKRLREEQIEPLYEMGRQANVAVQERSRADSELAAFDTAYNFVAKGFITNERALQALVEPLFGGGAYLTYQNGDYVFISRPGDPNIRRAELGGRRLSEESADLLRPLLEILNSPLFSEEIKVNFKKYLQTKDEAIFERIKILLANEGDSGKTEKVERSVKALQVFISRVNLRKDVYKGIVENDSPENIAQILARFEGKESADIALVRGLRDAVAAKRKNDVLKETIPLLTRGRRDVGRVLELMQPLIASNRDDQRKIGLEVVKLVYAAELAGFRDEVQKMIAQKADPETIRIYIDGFPVRPTVGDFDYVKTITEVRDKAFACLEGIFAVKALERTVKIRESFSAANPEVVLENISALPGESERERAVKVQLLELYKKYVAANRPDIFDARFAEEIRVREAEQLQAKFESPEKGKNKEGFNFVRDRFVETIYPLVESLRADGGSAGEKVREILDSEEKNPQKNPRRQFEQRLRQLEAQRVLTDREKNYLQSVELMSLFNPYLVACVFGDPGVTSEFLRHHFERISRETTSQLKDGDYVPLLQIGLGPNGLAALGEGVRNNAALMSEALVIDAGEQPGGPFAIPRGAAWELNSANKRGSAARQLPDAPGPDEIKTIRSYGSPLRWYPGERSGGKDTRGGSINATVDYLITPDDLSSARYPTNEELQIVLAMQAALLTKRVALQTKFVDMEPDPDPQGPKDEHGNVIRKIVTLEITEPTGKREVRIKTDAIWGSTGLGEPGYGFKLQGSRAEKVMQQTKDAAFPKICTTLEGFNAFADRTREQVSPGDTIVIWGKGNSADTLIEYIGSLFQGDNPRVRDITKIYVICDGDLSARPRYSLISDLKPRNGRGNLIEQINARVTDVDFASAEGDPATRKIVVYGQDGRMIRNTSGEVIVGDAGIAATGFRSKLDALFEGYAEKITGEKGAVNREPLVLPTNENVPVAETLKGDPTVLILGTASSPEFDKVDKLAQLPQSAREALLRNGAENAVAIGFRAPDVQAAVNIWLNTQEVRVEGTSVKRERGVLMVDEPGGFSPGEAFSLQTMVSGKERIPNNVADAVRALSPLFIYNVGNMIELRTSEGKQFTGELTFTLTYDKDRDELGLLYSKENGSSVSRQVVNAVRAACMDKDVQKYALVALKKKRRNPKLAVVLSFKNGFVDPRTTFIQE